MRLLGVLAWGANASGGYNAPPYAPMKGLLTALGGDGLGFLLTCAGANAPTRVRPVGVDECG